MDRDPMTHITKVVRFLVITWRDSRGPRAGDGWDHVWPVSRGGQSVPGNLVPACSTCNSRKKNNDPTPWVDRGLAAFPTEWSELIALASEHLTNEWLVTV